MFLGTTHNTSGWSTSVLPIKRYARGHAPWRKADVKVPDFIYMQEIERGVP